MVQLNSRVLHPRISFYIHIAIIEKTRRFFYIPIQQTLVYI